MHVAMETDNPGYGVFNLSKTERKVGCGISLVMTTIAAGDYLRMPR